MSLTYVALNKRTHNFVLANKSRELTDWLTEYAEQNYLMNNNQYINEINKQNLEDTFLIMSLKHIVTNDDIVKQKNIHKYYELTLEKDALVGIPFFGLKETTPRLVEQVEQIKTYANMLQNTLDNTLIEHLTNHSHTINDLAKLSDDQLIINWLQGLTKLLTFNREQFTDECDFNLVKEIKNKRVNFINLKKVLLRLRYEQAKLITCGLIGNNKQIMQLLKHLNSLLAEEEQREREQLESKEEKKHE